jgi:hypothetical protein
MTTQALLTALTERIQEGIIYVENQLLPESEATLNWKANVDSWSVLECIEHLNRYNRYYNTAIEEALAKNTKAAVFKSGWLGDFFVKSVDPTNVKPMKTRPHLNPGGSQLDKGVLTEFLSHQKHLLQLLYQAEHKNLNPRAVKVEIFRLIRMKTGDALRFVVTHQQRHLGQAERTLNQIGKLNHFVK